MNPAKAFFSEWKKSSPKEKLFMVGGGIFLAAAIVGVFIPVVPQIPFAIISAYLFSKGSPRLHRWIRGHKQLGPPVKDWEDDRVIRPKLKIISTLAMIGGAAIGHWKIATPWPLILDILFLIAIVFVLTRKSTPGQKLNKIQWDWRVIAGSIFVTIFVTMIVVNLYPPGSKVPFRVSPLYPINDENFERTMGNLLGPPMIGGNQITSLENGDQIFPEMIAAIQSAKKTITFETFIYWSGTIGEKFSKALSERARAGVKVLVILDAVGSSELDDKLLSQMKDAGVKILKYRSLHWYTLSKINNRTHRKLLIIDGLVGFTGGVGIADNWDGNGDSENHWRDSHFKIVGPVVPQLQAAFLDDWNIENADVPHGPDFFPPQKSVGKSTAQVFISSPQEGSNSVRLMYIFSIELAQKNIKIATAYFVPDEHVRKLLIQAANRGVKVEVILPGKFIDSKSTRAASRAIWGDLLKAGIKIYEFQPTMYHSKYMTVDDVWVSVGSTNFDSRSFQMNSESNLNVLDKDFAAERNVIFEEDKSKSKEITFNQWSNRPIFQKITDHIFSILNSQL